MAYDEQLANRIRRALGDRQGITERKMMRRRHARPMDFTGKPLKGFVYVSPPGFRTAAALRTWLSLGQRVAEAKAAGIRTRGPRGSMSALGPHLTSQARRSKRGG
jgi:hypothetical protein